MARAVFTRDAALTFRPDESKFNRANALYLAHASDVVYLRSPTTAAQQRLGLKTFAFRSKLTRARGYLGVCDTHAVLAFRGTDPITIPNWMTVAIVKLVTSGEYAGRVHHGFDLALRRTWNKVETILDEVQDKPLFLTGHSMGGALAVLAAVRLAKLGRPPIATYTFGAPRVGDLDFCSTYALPTYRVVNRLDLVPELPLASLKKHLAERLPSKNGKIVQRMKQKVEQRACYAHVNSLIYIDRDGEITADADIEPWHTKRSHAPSPLAATVFWKVSPTT